ncbi:hypothetical protein BDQ94DRAFT_148175 [Aspergillus welwitschiae]|uniref:Uncharacterized protein n=1 Tax=Aspergillus welwitschiae TaxID=1341132 RepID=A0A3F3PUM0_9EURO|nr:hypothetical protein BDQ94DRAFT_148175 [Aspergillus welwitschiae]RDH30613.1 hypothetical protein BDQ94DRAFT_148175 [Aspergillus welwitschiae]
MMYDFPALRSKDMLDWSSEVVPTYRTALFLSHFVMPSSTMYLSQCLCVCPGQEKKKTNTAGAEPQEPVRQGHHFP